jgi:RNA polymerase sigma-70 factor (ECF subfamily)
LLRQPSREAPTEANDRDLVKEARAGNHAAFRTLVERYQQKVYAMALSMMRDPDQARDAVQDAFIKAYEHLDTFQGDSSFYTWFYRIAFNLCIDRARRARRFTQVEFDEALGHEDEAAFEMGPQRLGFDPAQALHDREIRQRVMAALGELSPNHQTVLVLREVDGLAYKEIAEVMNCSIGTVMSRLFHARKRMQLLLRALVEGDEDRDAAGAGDATSTAEPLGEPVVDERPAEKKVEP